MGQRETPASLVSAPGAIACMTELRTAVFSITRTWSAETIDRLAWELRLLAQLADPITHPEDRSNRYEKLPYWKSQYPGCEVEKKLKVCGQVSLTPLIINDLYNLTISLYHFAV